jgi:calcineurin-like phosphoesterase
MHAETTSEKIAMGRFLDAKITASLALTPTSRRPTNGSSLEGQLFSAMRACADQTTPGLGRDHQPIIKRFMDGLPGNFPVAADPVRVCGAIIEVDENTGRALHISRVNETVSSE